MKLRNLLLSFVILLIINELNAQVIITKNDSIPIGNDSIVKIVLPKVRGNIQWQKSNDTKNWDDIENETSDTLLVKTVSEAIYRAAITDGTCDPVVSDSASLAFTKPELNSVAVSSVLQFSATLTASLFNDGGSIITETGFFVSENKDSILDGMKLLTSTDGNTFEQKITYLKPGAAYYVCAYATNSKGMSVSETVTYTTNEFEYSIFDLREVDEEGWDFRVSANDGSSYYVRFEGQEPASVFFTPDVNRDGYSIFFGENGLPSKVVIGDIIFLFDNYREGLVDIAVIQPEQEIKIFRDLQNNLSFSEEKSQNDYTEDEWLKFAIQTTNNLVGVTSCALLLLSGVGTIPAIVGCGVPVLSMLAQVTDTDWELLGKPDEFWIGATGNLYGLYGCYSGNISVCINTGIKLSLTLESLALEYINNNTDVPVAQIYLKLPSVITIPVTSITQTTATSGGNITSDGGATVTARGVCWSISPKPTTANSKTTNGTGTGSFTSSLNVLTANTTYYVRAYATNSAGTAYGNEVTFTTGIAEGPIYGSFTDPRDGHVYKTVKIGEQVWMAENLAYLPMVYPSSNGLNTEPRYYVYDYQGTDVAAAKQNANYTTYGVLYNWSAAKAACPPGWHLPSDAEWTALENYLTSNGYNYDGTTAGNKIAKSLATTTNWITSSDTGAIGNNLTLNNKSGFSAFPGGYRNGNGNFSSITNYSNWWSSTEYSSNSAWGRGLGHNNSHLYRGSYYKQLGFSVRCVRDK